MDSDDMTGRFIGVLFLIFAVMGGSYFFLLNHVGISEVGIAVSSWDGKREVQRDVGWYVTSPWTTVANVSTKPMTVCLGAGNIIVSCKLVRIVTSDEAVDEFIRQQGFSYYNTKGTANCADESKCEGMARILRGYAFGDQPYPIFIEILKSNMRVDKSN